MSIDPTSKIKKILNSLPDLPGVYLMKDKDDDVLYVGKAVSLKNRVRQYFHKSPNHSIGTRVMMKYIADIDFIVVSSEIEAIMLETTLIKKHSPRYNVRMRDDKNFVYIKITTDEDFPQILTVRKMYKDKAKYFGPYTSATVVKNSMKVIQKIFPYRTCSGDIFVKDCFKETDKIPQKTGVRTVGLSRKAPCLDYHIKRCEGPCIGNVSHIHYVEMIDKIVSFLKGDFKAIIDDLKSKMDAAVSEKRFESAARFRDQILAVESIMERQKMISTKDNNQDILTPFRYDKKKAFVNIVEIRGGKLIDVKNVEFDISGDSTEMEILEQFILQYYRMAISIPKEIILPKEIDNSNAISRWFVDELKNNVSIVVPKSGPKKKLLELGYDNAEKYKEKLDVTWDVSGKTKDALGLISSKFGLKKEPKRMECYDISHMSGVDTVGSMVVFQNGFAKKDHYRNFKIKRIQTVGNSDDFSDLREVLKRRLSYLEHESKVVLKNRDISLRRAKEKDAENINNVLKKEKLSSMDFDLEHAFLLIKEKKIVGTIIMREIVNDYELSLLWLDKDLKKSNIDFHFIREIQNKFKKYKLYVVVQNDQKDFYSHLGFVEIKKSKEELARKASTENQMMWKYNYEKPDASFSSCPDLIILDGGKGQLSSVLKLIKEMDIPEIPFVGFAKKENKFYISGGKEIVFPVDSEALYMLQRIRDEAHRFANSHREKLGSKRMMKSSLDDIPGVGEKTKKELLTRFGSIEGIKNASKEELTDCVGEKLSSVILNSF